MQADQTGADHLFSRGAPGQEPDRVVDRWAVPRVQPGAAPHTRNRRFSGVSSGRITAEAQMKGGVPLPLPRSDLVGASASILYSVPM